MNIYGIANEEMKRLYELYKIEREIELRSRDHHGMPMGISRHSASSQILKELNVFRQIIVAQLTDHDKKIQEKIAELSLTGTPDVQEE